MLLDDPAELPGHLPGEMPDGDSVEIADKLPADPSSAARLPETETFEGDKLRTAVREVAGSARVQAVIAAGSTNKL